MIVAYGNKANVNFGEYLINRLARIYPVYLLALFLTFGIHLLKNNVVIIDYLLNALMLRTWLVFICRAVFLCCFSASDE